MNAAFIFKLKRPHSLLVILQKKTTSYNELMSCVKETVDEWWKIEWYEFHKTNSFSFNAWLLVWQFYSICHPSQINMLLFWCKKYIFWPASIFSPFLHSPRKCFHIHNFFSLCEIQIEIKFSSSLPSLQLSLKFFLPTELSNRKMKKEKNHEKGMKWKQGRTHTFEWKKKFLSLVEGSIRRKKTTWYGENNG